MGPVEDADLEAELALDRSFDSATDARRVARTAEDDIPALEIGLDVLAPERRIQRPEARHRDEIVPADVDASQQRDVTRGHPLTVAVVPAILPGCDFSRTRHG